MNSAVTKGCLEPTDHFPCKSQAVPSLPPTPHSLYLHYYRQGGQDELQASPGSSKDHGPFPLSSASLAEKQDDEQSKLTSFGHTCEGSKSQIPIVLLRLAMELTSGY